MSTAVESRIVELRFDNKAFQKEVKSSVNDLKQLDDQLQFQNGTKGFDSVQRSADKLNFSGVQKQTGLIESALLKVKSVGVGAFDALTNAAGLFVKGAGLVTGVLNTGIVAKSIQGGWNRASNIGQAKFQLSGLGVEWEEISESLNFAVDQTAYGLDAAALAASQLVASGVELGDDMSHSLRAISGVAAMTNSTYEDTARIFTQVAGNGRLMGDQLLQLSSRGLNVAAVMGEAMGKTEAEIREMVSDGEISFKDFSDIMYETFGEHAVKANETFGGALSNISAALSRTTADFFLAVRGKEGMVPIFNDVRQLINDLNKQTNPLMHMFTDEEGVEKNGAIIQGVLDGLGEIHRVMSLKLESGSFVELFGKMIKEYTPDIQAFFSFFNKGIGSLTHAAFDISEVFMTAATTFGPYLDMIRNAFTDTFGDDAFGKLTSNIHAGLQEFKSWIETLAPTSDQLKAVYNGAKAVFEVIRGITDFIGDLAGGIFNALISGGTAINNWFKDLVSSAKEGEGAVGNLGDKIKDLFNTGIVANIKNFFNGIKETITNLFKGQDGKPLDIMKTITEGIENAWTIIHKVLDPQELSQLVNSLMAAITPFLGLIMQFRGGDFFYRLSLIPDRLLNKLKTAPDLIIALNDALIAINGAIGRISRSVARRQTSEALVNYAKALAILTASLVVLTLIDPSRLAGSVVALGAIGVVLVMLASLMSKLASVTSLATSVDMGVITTALIPLSIAIDLVSIAVYKLAKIPEESLDKGINSVFRLMLFMAIFAGAMTKINSGGLIAAATGLVITAAALLVMQIAVKKFADIADEDFESGLNRACFALIAMAGAMLIAASATGSAIKAALGMGIMIAALGGFLLLLKGFNNIDEGTIAKTLLTLAGTLIGLAVAVKVFSSPDMMKGAANLNSAMGAIGLMAIVLNLIAFAIANVMNASGGDIATLIVTMAGLAGVIIVMALALEVLARGSVMYEAGATSMLIMSAALLVLARTMTVLEAVPWTSIISSFLKLAVAIIALSVLGVIAEGLEMPLLALAVTLGALALAMLMGSAAVFMFAQALTIIGSVGSAAVESIIYCMIRIAQAIHENRDAIIDAAMTTGEAIGAALVGALKSVIMGLGDILATAIPAISSFLDEHGSDLINIGIQLGKLIITGVATAITKIPEMIWEATMPAAQVPEDAVVEFNEYGYTIVEASVKGTEEAASELENSEAIPEAVAANAEKAGDGIEEPLAESATEAANNALETASNEVNPDSFDLSNIFSEGGMNLDALSNSLLGDAEGIGGGLSDSLLKGAGDNPIDVESLMSGLGMDSDTMGGMFQSLGGDMGSEFSSGLNDSLSSQEGGGAINNAIDTELTSATSRTEEFRTVGQTSGQAYGSGVTDGIGSSDISEGINHNISKMNEASVPAYNAGTSVGQQFSSGEASGIMQQSGSVSGAASYVTNNAKWNAGGHSAGRDVGENFGAGMATGIYNKTGAVAKAAMYIVEVALRAAKKEADEKSPSKKTQQQGEYFGEGYAIGILNTLSTVATAAKAMADSGMSAVEDTVLQTSSLLDAVDWDSNPTITPVLDLSEVERGVGIMEGMMPNQVKAAAHANRIYNTVGSQNQNGFGGTTNVEVHLDWHAGTSANQMAQILANELGMYRATEGR